jgi:hypothetical protein
MTDRSRLKEHHMNPLDAVSFQVEGISFDSDKPNVRVFYTTDGDGLGLYYFPNAPDLPKGAANVLDIRAFYDKMIATSNAKVVEVSTLKIDGCQAVRTIIKVPQSPRGMTYLGTLTLPFKNFSYVLKIQCEERGPTGVREAVLFDKLLKEKKVDLDAAGKVTGNWNPDDPQFDDAFPEHPLSRLRRVLSRLQPAIRINARTKIAPPFYLPECPK